MVGGLVFASIDQVHPDLHDNAIILGCLSFLVAILFVIDLADPLARMTAHTTQTDSSSMTNVSRASETEKGITLKKDVSTDTEAPVYLISGKERYKDMNEPDSHRFVDSNGRDYADRDEPDRRSYRKSESRRQSYLESIGEGLDYSRESIVERKVLPSVQTPVFAHVRPAPEESRRIAGKEIQYLPRYDYRDRRDYRDAGPQSGRQSVHQQSPKAPSYHDNESFVEEISPSRRSTYVPADKFDNEAVQMNPRPRPPPPAKPTTSPTTAHGSGSGSGSSCSNCNCSQRSLPGRRREQGRDEPDIPIKPGYVANAAKKWDDRLRSKSQPIIGLNTMV